MLVEIVVVILIAFLLTAVLAGGFGWRYPGRPEPGPSMLYLFLLLLLMTWGIGLWVQPYGPTVYGAAWAPLLVIGLITVLFVLALAPPRPPATPVEAAAEREAEMAGVAMFGAFFWILLLVLLVSGIAALVS